MAFLIDTDIFIAAKNAHYPFDVCPAFWDWLARAHTRGEIVSTMAMREDLLGHEDELSAWARTFDPAFFLAPTELDLDALGRVTAHVYEHRTYSPAAKETFLSCSDYFVVSQALAGGHTVVTNEKVENSVHRIKIPSVCLALGVATVTPWKMLRTCGARFELAR